MSSGASLMLAVKEKHADEIRRLVADGAQLNCVYELSGDEARRFSVTKVKLLPLVFAANDGDLELCKLLVDLGASLKGTPKPSFLPSPLINALANKCSVSAVDTLVKLGCDVNEPSARSLKFVALPPLFQALEKDNFDSLKLLLEAGADVNMPIKFYGTLIHFAMDNDRHKRKNTSCCLDRLLDFIQLQVPDGPKPDLNAKDEYGKTPLMIAVCKPTMKPFDRLLKEGVDLDSEDNFKRTALHSAIESPYSEEKVLALLRAGCAISKPHWRHSAFLLAVSKGKERISEILVEFGASPLEKFRAGWTVLHAGASNGSQKLVDLALSAGVSVNALGYNGKTALMNATESNDHGMKFNGENIRLVKYLVQQHGAHLNIRSFKKKQTALTLCFKRYAMKCAMYLLAEGAMLTREERSLAYKRLCCGHDDRRLVKEECALKFFLLRMLVIEECALEFFLLTETASLSSCLAVYENSRCFNPKSRFYQKWKEVVCHPHSLKHCSRLAVRDALVKHADGTGILLVIETLLLPETLKTYLCYREEMDQAFHLIDKSKDFHDDDEGDDDNNGEGETDARNMMDDYPDNEDDDSDEDDDDDDDDFDDYESGGKNDIADFPGDKKNFFEIFCSDSDDFDLLSTDDDVVDDDNDIIIDHLDDDVDQDVA